MGQQSLIYSFVARGTVILSEYTEFTGNFTSIASQCLQKLPATNNRRPYLQLPRRRRLHGLQFGCLLPCYQSLVVWHWLRSRKRLLIVTFEKKNPRDGFKQFWNADNESEIHHQGDRIVSEFAEPKRPSFLRRSLAWDSEFLTCADVLDHEELFLINKGFKKAKVPQLSRIQEDVRGCRSAGSKSTLTASKKVDSGSRNKLKSVSASKSESIKQGAVIRPNISQRTARSKESIMSSPKPPKILANPISAKQRERTSLGSESVQMDHKARKTRSGPDLKVSKKSRLGDLSVPIASFTPPRKSDSLVSFTKDSTACCPSYDSGSSASSSKHSSKSKTGISSRNARLGHSSLMSNHSSCTSPSSSFDGWSSESLSSTSFASKRPTPCCDTATRTGSCLVYDVIRSSELQRQEIKEGKFTSQCTTRVSIGTGSVSAELKRTGKSSGLRKPSPKIGFFDEDHSMQPVVRGRLGFHFGGQSPLPNISGPMSQKRTSRLQPAKTVPDPDVSPAMERESSSKTRKTGMGSGLMGERLRMKGFSRNKMSVDRKRDNDNGGYVQGGATNSDLKKHDDAIPNIIGSKENQKENICNYEDQVSGLSRYLEGVDLNRDVVIEGAVQRNYARQQVVDQKQDPLQILSKSSLLALSTGIEQTPSSRTPLADKTSLSNRGGVFGLSVDSTSDMLFEKSVHLQEGPQKENI